MDPKALKQEVLELYNKYVRGDIKTNEVDVDIQKAYGKHRKQLEKNVTNYKEKLRKESDKHKKDNMRILKENTELINEINGLKKEVKSLTNLKR
jgi:hypothetical protein